MGGGHNGLVAAAYLARLGVSTAVFERREVLGGAAVTEEIVPGYQFSRASYVLSLLRPAIIRDLQLANHGLKVLPTRLRPLAIQLQCCRCTCGIRAPTPRCCPGWRGRATPPPSLSAGTRKPTLSKLPSSHSGTQNSKFNPYFPS